MNRSSVVRLALAALFVSIAVAGIAAEPVAATVGGFKSPDGKERMHCPLPGVKHQRNTGGSDGAGLCVYASARHTGRWQGDPLFDAGFEWMRRHPGGSYPSKFTQTMSQCANELGLATPDYIQVESNDLEILKLACRNGYMPGVTYGISPTGRYNGRAIAHMVTLTHASDSWFCVLDNNYPGADAFEWATPREFARSYSHGSGRGWAIILLTVPPPPAPHNGK